MKKLALAVAVVMLALSITACNKPTPPTAPTAAQSNPAGPLTPDPPVSPLRTTLASSSTVNIDDTLIELFYDYYTYNAMELRLLPTFRPGEQPSWDAMSFFVFAMSCDMDTSVVPMPLFDNTFMRFFIPYKYSHKSSAQLDLTSEGYVPLDWSIEGEMFYRLSAISKDPSGIYSATFNGYLVDGNDESKNWKAITAESDNQDHDVAKAIKSIFKNPDYQNILEKSQTVTTTFKLSNDADYAFTYLSCTRK